MSWTVNHTKKLIGILRLAMITLIWPVFLVDALIRKLERKYSQKWNRFVENAGCCKKCLTHKTHFILMSILLLSSQTAQADTGIATWYSVQSTKAEGNTGITASGEKLNEASFTAALRSYQFGKRYKVTNLKNGKSIIVKHNDFGPGKKPSKRGVIIDLTPCAFDALGGKRGKNWGEFPVRVEVVK